MKRTLIEPWSHGHGMYHHVSWHILLIPSALGGFGWQVEFLPPYCSQISSQLACSWICTSCQGAGMHAVLAEVGIGPGAHHIGRIWRNETIIHLKRTRELPLSMLCQCDPLCSYSVIRTRYTGYRLPGSRSCFVKLLLCLSRSFSCHDVAVLESWKQDQRRFSAHAIVWTYFCCKFWLLKKRRCRRCHAASSGRNL